MRDMSMQMYLSDTLLINRKTWTKILKKFFIVYPDICNIDFEIL